MREFIKRDADDPEHPNGQHVTDAFHEADFFVDNTPDVPMPPSGDMKDAIDDRLIGELSRLVSIILHDRIHRPTIEELAMHSAYSAQLQSSCLSRQVGAALVDEEGNIVATGTNEVPQAGGGVYGENVEVGAFENRCAFCYNKGKGPFCSNNEQQNELLEDAIKVLFGKDIGAYYVRYSIPFHELRPSLLRHDPLAIAKQVVSVVRELNITKWPIMALVKESSMAKAFSPFLVGALSSDLGGSWTSEVIASTSG